MVKSNNLEVAARNLLALMDGVGRVEINGQVIDAGGGFSQQQFDDAVAELRVALDGGAA